MGTGRESNKCITNCKCKLKPPKYLVKSIHLALAKLKCTFVPRAMLSHFTWMWGKIEWALWLRFTPGGGACSKINSKDKEKTTKFRKVCSINFEPPDIDLCSACHVYPLFCGAWIISILFILNKLTWGLDFII